MSLNSEALDINQLQQIMRLTGTPPASLISRMPSHEVRHAPQFTCLHTLVKIPSGVVLTRLCFLLKVGHQLARGPITDRCCESYLVIFTMYSVSVLAFSLIPPISSLALINQPCILYVRKLHCHSHTRIGICQSGCGVLRSAPISCQFCHRACMSLRI